MQMKLTYPHLWSLRLAALLAILRTVALDAALVLGALSLLANRALLLPALITIAVSVILMLVSFAQAPDLKCVLCRVPLFLPRNCSKNPKVKTFLGSRLLRMCGEILFSSNFRCMYCGERCGCRKSSPSQSPRPSTGHGLRTGHPIPSTPSPQPVRTLPSLRETHAASAPLPTPIPQHAAHQRPITSLPREFPVPVTTQTPPREEAGRDRELDDAAMAFALKLAITAIPEQDSLAYKKLWHQPISTR